MDQPKPKRNRVLEVQVSFEVSRLSPEHLVAAYEQILPPVRRATALTQPSCLIDLTLESQPIGEANHECS
jgi:hypothetical protein